MGGWGGVDGELGGKMEEQHSCDVSFPVGLLYPD